VRNKDIYDTVLGALKESNMIVKDLPEVEQVARYLFRQLCEALVHLHEDLNMVHRDIKLDNILFNSRDL
jgi:serine/threonine protein kinase